MLNFKYISSRGNEYDLLTTAAMLTECNAFDYKYKPVTFGKRYGAKIYGFEMDIKEFEATFYVFGDNRKEYINELIADFDNDVATLSPGTFICNGYSIKGYSPSASDSSNNSSSLLWDTFARTFVCEYPFWSKQTLFQLFSETSYIPEWADIKDYLPVSEDGKADYEWDYMTHVGKNGTVVNNDLVGSEWQIIINGGTINPEIRIGDLVIQMDLTVTEGETLTIDSRTKTIILTTSGGSEENVFGYRDVSVDIFQKIPKGTLPVWWDDDAQGEFSFTLALFDERTAPLWN